MNNIVKFLAVVACWVVYPKKSYKRATFQSRKNRAILQADKRQATTCERVMVMQDGTDFYVGIACEFKQLMKKVNKYVKLPHELRKVYDWKKAIIYKAK